MSLILFGILMSLLAFALANGRALMRRLESAHPDVWHALGRPNFTASTGLAPRLALVRFIWSRRYRALQDEVLARHCLAALLAEPLLVCVVLYLVLA